MREKERERTEGDACKPERNSEKCETLSPGQNREKMRGSYSRPHAQCYRKKGEKGKNREEMRVPLSHRKCETLLRACVLFVFAFLSSHFSPALFLSINVIVVLSDNLGSLSSKGLLSLAPPSPPPPPSFFILLRCACTNTRLERGC